MTDAAILRRSTGVIMLDLYMAEEDIFPTLYRWNGATLEICVENSRYEDPMWWMGCTGMMLEEFVEDIIEGDIVPLIGA